jgi:hypothetical protein
MDEPETIVDIRDPEINVEELMQRIHRRLQHRRLEAQLKGLDCDAPVGPVVDAAGGFSVTADLQSGLREMSNVSESLFVAVSVRDQRLPLINDWVNRLKEAFHTLVVMYVNALAGRQTVFNRMTTSVISELVRRIQEEETRRATLESELANLRARLTQLESRRPQ